MLSSCGVRVPKCGSGIQGVAEHRLGFFRHAIHLRQPRSLAVAAAQQQSDSIDDVEAQDKKLAAISLAASLGGGLLLSQFGLDEALPDWCQQASSALGWSYVFAWSISFYPQVIENAQRKSVDGLSADYLMYSVLGYTAYAAYTAALHFNPGVQAAYMAAHAGSAPDVQLTDFLFAGHALLVTLYTLYQCTLYGSNSSGNNSSGSGGVSRVLTTSPVCNCIAAAVLAAVVAYSGHIGSTCGPDDCDAWLPMLYLLGFIKVSMTLIKYTPQAMLNAERRSTEGWSINNVLLDLSGGMLSFAQVGLNAFARGDLSVITGNPAKLGISLLSIAFDVLFIMQHYVWFPSSSSSSTAGGGTASGSSSSASTVTGGGSSSDNGALLGNSRSSGSRSSSRPLGRRLIAVAVRAASGVRRQ